MSIKEAKLVIEEYGLVTDEYTIEIVLEAINKYQNARNLLIEGLKPEYKYLKKLSKLLAMIDEKPSYDTNAEKIATLMHDIYKIVSRDSEKKGEDFLLLMSKIDVRKTFKPTDLELWVMQYLGGREFIAKINFQDPNQLNRRILNAIERYRDVQNNSSNPLIENNLINNIKLVSR